MTYLSVKALRYYHDVGLLVRRWSIGTATGTTRWTRWAPPRPSAASGTWRCRSKRCASCCRRPTRPAATGPSSSTWSAYRQLGETRARWHPLQALRGEGPGRAAAVEIRRLPATRAVVARGDVAFDDCADWLTPALDGLRAEVGARGLTVASADGALYSDAFFEAGVGEVTAFVPVVGDGPEAVDLPATTAAVLVHDGPFADLDRTYGALTVVAEMGVAGAGPIREYYLSATSTEVCWPVAGAPG